jgi:hypothetical protein
MKERDCRVSACVNGECRGCKRKRGMRRGAEVRRMCEDRGLLTPELEAEAEKLFTARLELMMIEEIIRPTFSAGNDLVEWL